MVKGAVRSASHARGGQAGLMDARSAPDPCALFAAYRGALERLDGLPLAFWIRRRESRLGRIPTLRSRPLLRFFVVWHMTVRLDELRRTYNAEAALHPNDPSYDEAARRVEAFARSVPPARLRRMLVVGLLSVFVVAFLLASDAAPHRDPTGGMFKHGSAKVTMRDAAKPLAKMTGASLTLSPTEFGNALRSFPCKSDGNGETCSARRGLTSVIATLIILSIAVWLVAIFPVAAFRLKRMLFNLGESPGLDLRSERASDHFASAAGIYRIEANLFQRLGRHTPREVPLDLLSQSCLVVIPLWLAGLSFVFASTGIVALARYGFYPDGLTAVIVIYLTAAFVFSLATARLAALRWTYRSRLEDAANKTSGEPRSAQSFAAWRRRAAAFALDAAFIAVLAFPFAELLSPSSDADLSNVLLVFLVVPAAAAAYESLFLFLPRWTNRGQTLGKRLAAVRITRTNGEEPSAKRLLFRNCALKWLLYGPPWLLVGAFLAPDYAGEVFAFLVMGIGLVLFAFSYVCPLWNSRMATLHDLLTDTVVIRDPVYSRVRWSVPRWMTPTRRSVAFIR